VSIYFIDIVYFNIVASYLCIVDSHESNIIVVYDGDCNLCNYWIRKIKRHKKASAVEVVPLKEISSEHKAIIQFNKHLSIPDSIIVIEGKTILIESNAILKISKILGGWFNVLLAGYIIPNYLRDRLYRFIARNRYKWFGRRVC